MNLNKQNLINKILYRARYRGTKEMDIFVTSFVNSIVDKLNISELSELNEIVNLNDEQIINLCNNDSKNYVYNKRKVYVRFYSFYTKQ